MRAWKKGFHSIADLSRNREQRKPWSNLRCNFSLVPKMTKSHSFVNAFVGGERDSNNNFIATNVKSMKLQFRRVLKSFVFFRILKFVRSFNYIGVAFPSIRIIMQCNSIWFSFQPCLLSSFLFRFVSLNWRFLSRVSIFPFTMK